MDDKQQKSAIFMFYMGRRPSMDADMGTPTDYSSDITETYLHPLTEATTSTEIDRTDRTTTDKDHMMMKILTMFWDWIDNRAIIRRGTLLFTLWMTFWVTYGCIEFAVIALANKYDGLHVAAIITAIMAPTAALQGFALRDYSNSKKEGMLK